MTTREDIEHLIVMMKAAFPNFHPEPGTPLIYHQLLGDLDLEELKAAVLACVSEPGRAFAPSIGEIRGAALNLRKQARGLPSASDAWGEVYRQMVDVGHTGTPVFSVPLVGELVRRFGWHNLCMSENMIADRAHFMRAYELAAEEEMQRDIQLPAVTKYIDEHSARRLEVTQEVKQLAARLGNPNRKD